MKIRSGDQVVVITGKDKGKTGRVLRVLGSGRLVVSDANMRTKHIRGSVNKPGQIIKYEASLDSSNVMLVDPKSNKRTRIGFEVTEKGKKRIAKRSGEEVKAGKIPEKKELDKEKKEAASSTDKKETPSSAKATEDKKEKKEVKKKKEKKTERVDAPDKKAFWKGLKFGAEAMDELDDKEGSRSKEDRPVSDQGKTPDTFTHKRGE